MLEKRNCVGCDAILLEDPAAPRLPCPVCSHNGRRYSASLADSLALSDGYRVKHKRPGVKRPLAEERNEPSYFVRDGEWHRRYLLVDRVNNIYKETITRLSTGEVLLEKDERLSDHVGYGDDKRSRDEP